MPLPRLLPLLLALFPLPLAAGDWDNWRGPAHNGSSPELGLPATFSRTENVKWSVALPGPSAATPVIHGDRVFVTAADAASGQQAALCLDRRTGAVLWRADISAFSTDGQYSNSCSPSPVTDGRTVVFFFGTGELVAFTVEGRKLWERNLGPFAFQWTFATSPLLHDGRLVIQVLQRDVAVRGRGKPTGNESYLLACAPKNAPVYAVKAGGQGTLSFRDLAWQSHVQQTEVAADVAPSRNERDLTSDVPSPLYYGGRFYILNGVKRKLYCVNPADGAVIWSGDLGGRSVLQAPPTAADGRIYVMNFDADVFVIQAGGDAFRLLHNRTQAVVSRSLEQLQCTRVVIAHRLSTVVNADRIHVLAEGRIVQTGTYEELAAQEGLFRDLVRRQVA